MATAEMEAQPAEMLVENPAEEPTQELETQESVEPQVENQEKEVTELDKYWKAVKDNPTDFTGWTYLLQYVEQEIEADKAREAFDAFLQRYPYCYGYWKKYADLERKHENYEKAVEVFERGLEVIPLSIDLWIHYINCASGQLERTTETEEMKELKIRGLYERSITAAGTDFKSDKLWEMYIYWEKERKNLQNVTALYDRILTIPTQLYSHQFDQFQEHVKSHHPKDILSLDEFLRLRQKVIASRGSGDVTAEPGGDEAGPPGLEPEEGMPPGEAPPPGMEGTPEAPKIEEDEETTGIREKIIELRETVHRLNEQEVSKRWSYEEGIRRPYFHVKPLERGQLKIWKEYLDFEIQSGSHERVVVLFERCLIACALYEEFWLKYAKYMEPHSIDGVRHIFTRACRTHLPRKPNLHMSWAAFEERQGDHAAAAEVLDTLEQSVPGLVMIALRRISLQRRLGNFESVDAMYKKYIEDAASDEMRSFYAIKYGRYQAKIIGNKDKAKEVMEVALEKDTTNVKLYLQLIDLEYSRVTVDEAALSALFEKAMGSPIAIEHRVAFSQRRLEFMEDFSSNVARILDAYEEHQNLLKESQTSQKRKPEDDAQPDASKKAKVETKVVATAATTAATTTTAATVATTNGSGDVAQPAAYSQADYSQYNSAYQNYGQQGWGGYGNYGYGQQQGWGAYGSHYYGTQ